MTSNHETITIQTNVTNTNVKSAIPTEQQKKNTLFSNCWTYYHNLIPQQNVCRCNSSHPAYLHKKQTRVEHTFQLFNYHQRPFRSLVQSLLTSAKLICKTVSDAFGLLMPTNSPKSDRRMVQDGHGHGRRQRLRNLALYISNLLNFITYMKMRSQSMEIEDFMREVSYGKCVLFEQILWKMQLLHSRRIGVDIDGENVKEKRCRFADER